MTGASWRIGAAIGLAAALLTAGAPAGAETRVLLVGVSHFSSTAIRDLKGPENDLTAMDALMRAQGATDVTVLRDDQVSRTSVETALHALGLRAKPGDWIMFYFSGHGAQADAAVKGTRDGDYDQFVPLPKFDPEHQDAERFIVDKDFYDWFARYIPTNVQLLMMADTCHSGSLNRSADPRAFRFTSRLALRAGGAEMGSLVARPSPRFPGTIGSPSPAATDARAATDRADLPNVIFVAAAQDGQLALEAAMPGEGAPSRGLLTYAFEQGLTTRTADGKALAADLDADGAVSVGEIASYVDSQVRSLTSQRQQPKVTYVTGKESARLFVTPALPPAPPAPPPLPAIYPVDAAARAQLGGSGRPWTVAPAAAQADFLWDVAAGNLWRRSGDVVATGITTTAAVRGAVEKWRTIDVLRPYINEARARVTTGPKANGTRYATGAVVDVRLDLKRGASADGYATVFNLASDGTVQALYPVADDDGDGRLGPGGVLPLVESRVGAPFGTDHVVALVSDRAPDELRAMVRGLDGQRGAGKLVDAVQRLLAAEPGRASLSIGEIISEP